MSRDLPPGNGVPQLQNLNALLAYSGDLPLPLHLQNGGGGMNGNSTFNGSGHHRKPDYLDNGVGEYKEATLLLWLDVRITGIRGK